MKRTMTHRWWILWVGLAAFGSSAAGCGDSDGGEESSGSGASGSGGAGASGGDGGSAAGAGEGGGGEAPIEPSTHFGDAFDWAVPSGGWVGQGFVRLAAAASDPGDDDWATTDIDGDGIPDLVVTAHYDGGTFAVLGGMQNPRWDVYRGTSSGLSTSPTTWTLPQGGWTGQGFVRLGGNASDPGDDDWTTTDIDGDGILDLVVTAHYDGGTFAVLGGMQNPRWDVYRGTGSGFSASPTTWTLPQGGWTGQGFVRLGGNASDPGDDDWTTTDIDGDGILDLVVTAHYDGGTFAVLGGMQNPRWDVYRGTGSGFSASPTAWSLPQGGWTGQGFVRLSANASDPGDDDWTTTDIDGDGILDLVVTAHYDGGTFAVLGGMQNPRWDVYLGTGSGFSASPTAWTLPQGGWTGQGFVRLSANASDPGDDDWTTTDIDGDGFLDLVVTAHYDGGNFGVLGGAQNPRWDVYRGSDSGFGAVLEWPLPQGGWAGQGFVRLAASASDPGDDDWTTTDIDGDGRLDLLVTSHYDGFAYQVLGMSSGPHWRAYRGTP